MRRIVISSLSAVFVLVGVAVGQIVEMGNNLSSTNSSDVVLGIVHTDIDLVRPATATGAVDSATFIWSAYPCTAAVKIKFFRRQSDTLVFLDERGPFTTGPAPQTVNLSPPVVVQQGDLIGITRLADCGNPTALHGIVSAGYVEYAGDLTTNVSLSGADFTVGDVLAVYATGTATESIAGVLAAAGSTPGNFGSFFKTGVQLYNPGSSAIAGRFVYHPALVSGSSGDPSLSFSVGAGVTVSYDDLVATMGQTGLGSIDVVLPEPTPLHVIVARIYNDAGAAGTSGFTEEAIDPASSDSRVFFAGATGFLVAPSDVTHFRFNIGVRSLLSGAVITFTQRDASGVLVRAVTKTYQPTFYEQQSAETFLGGPLGANDSIQVSVSSGSAIVYGATVDNTTNDPSAQFARVVFAIAAVSTEAAPAALAVRDPEAIDLRREKGTEIRFA
ncbi:MAG TPA: hypothetical protein VGL03_16345 [Thermoanaerobaculia bacterium]